VFLLEGVLLMNRSEKDDASVVNRWLSDLKKYSNSHPGIEIFLVTGHTEAHLRTLLEGTGIDSFFSKENVWAVNESYLSSRNPVDRERYEEHCKEDPMYRDEYFRQVKIIDMLLKRGLTADQVLLVGHDYWFDGFYTRRFSRVDIAFVEGPLSSRGKPIPERLQGLWYISRSFKDIQKIIEGKVPAPNYNFLDAFINITLSEQLFGGKGLPQLKRVVIQRKKEGGSGDVIHIGE
jgi:hypothetical protein